MPINTQTVTITVPLLFLLITQFSAIARDMNLNAVAQEQHTPLLFPPFEELYLPKIGRISVFPSFGRFNFLHGINTVILVLVLALVVSLLSGTMKVVTALIASLVWLILPTLEIDEYDRFLDNYDSRRRNGDLLFLPEWWHSLHTHMVWVIVSAPLTTIVVSSLSILNNHQAISLSKLSLALPLIFCLSLTYLLPLHQLQRELKLVNSE